MPVDGLPYVGRLPLTERIQVATGFKKWGLSNGVAAAQILAGNVDGDPPPWAYMFDATRGESLSKYAKLVAENAEVARRFLADRVTGLDGRTVGDVAHRDRAPSCVPTASRSPSRVTTQGSCMPSTRSAPIWAAWSAGTTPNAAGTVPVRLPVRHRRSRGQRSGRAGPDAT